MKSSFQYCPNCKNSKLRIENESKIICSSCNFEYYHNVAGAVAVIIQNKDKILFTVRNKNPQAGMLDLPGGFIDPKETAENACKRELNEELNISIDESKLKYLNSNPNTYLYKEILYNTIDLFYLYRDDKLEITDFDSLELKGFVWKSLDEIKLEELAFESQKKSLSLIMKNK